MSCFVLSFPSLFCPELFFLVLFYPTLFGSRSGLLARVTPCSLKELYGCRVDEKHMGTPHSTPKQLMGTKISTGKKTAQHHSETWQVKSRYINGEDSSAFVCLGRVLPSHSQTVILFHSQNLCLCVRKSVFSKILHMNNTTRAKHRVPPFYLHTQTLTLILSLVMILPISAAIKYSNTTRGKGFGQNPFYPFYSWRYSWYVYLLSPMCLKINGPPLTTQTRPYTYTHTHVHKKPTHLRFSQS